MSKISAAELERQIFELEEIRVVIRGQKSEQKYEFYNYARKASNNTSVSDWYSTRLKPIIRTDDATIIDGSGNIPHGRTNIETVRNSYIRWKKPREKPRGQVTVAFFSPHPSPKNLPAEKDISESTSRKNWTALIQMR